MKTKVGIVEDNPDIRNALAEWINSSPDCVCVCVCPSAEIALIEVPRCRPDVVLMDIRLPGESGITCTAKLRDVLPRLLIIVLTVYRDRDLLFQALKAGACGYLLKRSAPEEVLSAISDVCSGGAPMTSEIARMLVETFRKPNPIKQVSKEFESANLSEREMEILSKLATGMANKEISAKLNISFFTVRAHLRNIYEKLHVRCRAEAVAHYLQCKS
ncbi:MAG: DNA-binding response regulator [Verrucomicrobiales bacterium]|nr:DNA-binding response regulator [Verrucomicrobiales bacterium]MDB6131251.1 DNA-binding response regulator [Verrucomicrobiales bacterium]